MCGRQYPLAVGVAGALPTRPVIEARSMQAAVALPAVGVNDRAGGDAGGDEGGERSGRGIGQQLQPQSSRAVAAHLDRNPNQRLAVTLAAAAEIGIAAAQEAFVDLDLVGELRSLECHHRTAQLVQDGPRRHRRLPSAALAQPDVTTLLSADLAATARRAGKTIRPARGK